MSCNCIVKFDFYCLFFFIIICSCTFYRQSQSVERPSRIPLRSSSQSGRDRGIPQNQNKQRSKSQATLGSSETPLNHGKFTPQIGSRMTSGASSNASSKKPTYYKDPRNLQDKEFQREASQLVNIFSHIEFL